MRDDEVPQFRGSAYGGHRKLLYALDRAGNYRGVESIGCEIEAHATYAAVEELAREARDAWERARRGETSPLAYHMYRARMDPELLAGAAGVARWRVRRHLQLAPRRFTGVSVRVRRRYAAALGLDVEALFRLPEAP